uniref:Spike glycoprotein fusion domain-containing protein n=1 Tax=Wenling dimarhabdovirus 10 TaxID=2116360 RepID=A0A2P1GNH9_9RHAB|nr:hypothetical protein [Wenling dimarhabdovirus 10]
MLEKNQRPNNQYWFYSHNIMRFSMSIIATSMFFSLIIMHTISALPIASGKGDGETYLPESWKSQTLFSCDRLDGTEYGCRVKKSNNQTGATYVQSIPAAFGKTCANGMCYEPLTQTWTGPMHPPQSKISFRRQKRSVSSVSASGIVAPLCPPIKSFRPLQVSDLLCDTKMPGPRTPISARMISRSSTVTSQVLCSCQATAYRMSCFSYFFGGVKTWSSSTVYQPGQNECINMCKRLEESSYTSIASEPLPGYTCHWMKTVTTVHRIVTVQRVNAITDWIERSYKSSELTSDCMWDSEHCRTRGGGYIYTQMKSNEPKKINPKPVKSIVVKVADDTYSYYYSHVLIMIDSKCAVSLNGEKYMVSSGGDLWLDLGKPPTTICSSYLTASGYVQKFSLPTLNSDQKSAILEYYICLVSKQSIANSLSTRTAIDPRILTQFGVNLFTVPKQGNIITGVLKITADELVTAKCVIHDGLKLNYKCPDIFMMVKNSVEIGCFDARLQIGLMSGCTCYPNHTSTRILNKYPINRFDNFAVLPDPSSITFTIQAITEFTDEMKRIYSGLLKPLPIYVYDNGTAAGLFDSSTLDEQWVETGVAKWWKELTGSLRAGIITSVVVFLLIVIGIIWIVMGLRCMPCSYLIRCMKICHYRRKGNKAEAGLLAMKNRHRLEDMKQKTKNTKAFLRSQNTKPNRYKILTDDENDFE